MRNMLVNEESKESVLDLYLIVKIISMKFGQNEKKKKLKKAI